MEGKSHSDSRFYINQRMIEKLRTERDHRGWKGRERRAHLHPKTERRWIGQQRLLFHGYPLRVHDVSELRHRNCSCTRLGFAWCRKRCRRNPFGLAWRELSMPLLHHQRQYIYVYICTVCRFGIRDRAAMKISRQIRWDLRGLESFSVPFIFIHILYVYVRYLIFMFVNLWNGRVWIHRWAF